MPATHTDAETAAAAAAAAAAADAEEEEAAAAAHAAAAAAVVKKKGKRGGGEVDWLVSASLWVRCAACARVCVCVHAVLVSVWALSSVRRAPSMQLLAPNPCWPAVGLGIGLGPCSCWLHIQPVLPCPTTLPHSCTTQATKSQAEEEEAH
jgi:hypothetical protein